jgi:site-specific recombinase XerC
VTVQEAEQVIAQPDVTDTLGLRDRALIETLYSTGMRRHVDAALSRDGKTGPISDSSSRCLGMRGWTRRRSHYYLR